MESELEENAEFKADWERLKGSLRWRSIGNARGVIRRRRVEGGIFGRVIGSFRGGGRRNGFSWCSMRFVIDGICMGWKGNRAVVVEVECEFDAVQHDDRGAAVLEF